VKIVAGKEKVEELLSSRYLEAILPSRERAEEMLMSGRGLTFYLGIDPTGPDIHLGHTTNLFVLKRLWEAGHKIILLIGDFTATIGDPTDKEAARRPLTDEEVKENMRTYLDQVRKILPKGSFETEHNSKWYRKMSVEEWLKITSLFTQQQMVSRDMFQERIKKDKPISLQEFVYPVLQGYDSVAMDVDGEVGGNDQTFNMLAGRDLLRRLKGKEKIVITTRLLEDPATGKKIMNKSEGQYISLNDPPGEMFGKTMAMPDSAIVPLFAFTTEVPNSKVEEIKIRLKSENPKNVKEDLAFELVRMYYGEEEADRAKEEFRKVFSEGQLPENIEEVVSRGNILQTIVAAGIVSSRSEGKRLIEQGAVEINGRVINRWDYVDKAGDILKVGPRMVKRIK